MLSDNGSHFDDRQRRFLYVVVCQSSYPHHTK